MGIGIKNKYHLRARVRDYTLDLYGDDIDDLVIKMGKKAWPNLLKDGRRDLIGRLRQGLKMLEKTGVPRIARMAIRHDARYNVKLAEVQFCFTNRELLKVNNS